MKGANVVMVLTVSLAIIVIFIAEGLPLARNKLWKELTTFGTLLGIALLLIIFNKLGIPGPLILMDELFSPVGKAIYQKN